MNYQRPCVWQAATIYTSQGSVATRSRSSSCCSCCCSSSCCCRAAFVVYTPAVVSASVHYYRPATRVHFTAAVMNTDHTRSHMRPPPALLVLDHPRCLCQLSATASGASRRLPATGALVSLAFLLYLFYVRCKYCKYIIAVYTRGAPIMLWPIIRRPIIGAKLSAHYRLFISGRIFVQ